MSETTTRAEGDLTPTPGQTIGPFYGFALPFERGHELVNPAHPKAVRLQGTVYDGHGAEVSDSLIEIWQLDADGQVSTADGSLVRDGYTFTGWGRTAVDNAGRFTFTTVEPGPASEGTARFVHVVVFARGLLDKLHTRMYLPADAQPEGALEKDALLSSLDAADRDTLIARRGADGGLEWDIHLQGDKETAFLTYDDAR